MTSMGSMARWSRVRYKCSCALQCITHFAGGSPMIHMDRVKYIVGTIIIALAAALLVAQQDVPQNSLPNPYRTIENWAKLPGDRPWGSTSAVDIGSDGNIWV